MTLLTQQAIIQSGNHRPNFAMPDLSDYMTTKDAAKARGFHVKSVQNMVKNNVLVGKKSAILG